MAAENCDIQPGDTVAVWGCGPVGQFAIQSAWMLGAERVIAHRPRPRAAAPWPRRGRRPRRSTSTRYDVYETPEGDDRRPRARRLHRRRRHGGARRARVDAVVRQGEGSRHAGDRPARTPCAQAIMCCRKGGTVSIPGVYGGFLDKFPLGAALNKGLTFKMGQTHVHTLHASRCSSKIEQGEIDPSFVDHPPARPRRRPRGLQDLPRQEGRLHQGRAEAGRAPAAPCARQRQRP